MKSCTKGVFQHAASSLQHQLALGRFDELDFRCSRPVRSVFVALSCLNTPWQEVSSRSIHVSDTVGHFRGSWVKCSRAAIASWIRWPRTTKQRARAVSTGGSAGTFLPGRSARGRTGLRHRPVRGAAWMSLRTAAGTGATRCSTELSPSHAMGTSPALYVYRRGQMVLRQNNRRGFLLGDDRGCTTPLARRMMSSREKIT